ncbi:hypothetical protein FRB95_007971 [Tulasnella sp. JGI-2019a]|nr:hypothetical protein FRB95_007971 [Tulasnella sp. JGI-2019a]
MQFLVFSGSQDEDVTAFLQNVKKIAFVEGKSRDSDWLVDYVESCLSGVALDWYDALGEDVQMNWGELRHALLKQFTFRGGVSTATVEQSLGGDLRDPSEIAITATSTGASSPDIPKESVISAGPSNSTDQLDPFAKNRKFTPELCKRYPPLPTKGNGVASVKEEQPAVPGSRLASPLSRAQLTELSSAIERMEGHTLEKVITIIQNGVPGIKNNTDEIEIEIDALPASVLVELFNLAVRPLEPSALASRL